MENIKYVIDKISNVMLINISHDLTGVIGEQYLIFVNAQKC